MYAFHKRVSAPLLTAILVGGPVLTCAPLWPDPRPTPLSLDECIGIALDDNQTLMVAEEKLRQARAARSETRGRFRPQIGTTATYTRLDQVPFISLSSFPMTLPAGQTRNRIELGDDDNYAVALTARQPLFTGFKILNAYRIADHVARAEQLRLQQARAEVVLQVKRGYFSVLKAEGVGRVAQLSVSQMEAHTADVANLFAVGLAAMNDLLRAQVQLSNAKLMAIRSENAIEMARIGLCDVLGIPLNTQISLTADLSRMQPDTLTLDDEIEAGLASRPELAAVVQTTHAAQRGVALAQGERLPDLMLLGNYNFKRPNRQYEPEFYSSWNLSVALQWSLFDGGVVDARIEQARSRLAQVRTQASQLRDAVILEVTRSHLAVAEARLRIETAAENVEQAEENYRVTSEQYGQGLVTNTELLDAQTLLTQARVDHTTSLADYHVAAAALEKATGLQPRSTEGQTTP